MRRNAADSSVASHGTMGFQLPKIVERAVWSSEERASERASDDYCPAGRC